MLACPGWRVRLPASLASNPMNRDFLKWLGCALVAILGLLLLQIEPQRAADAAPFAQGARAHAGAAAPAMPPQP